MIWILKGSTIYHNKQNAAHYCRPPPFQQGQFGLPQKKRVGVFNTAERSVRHPGTHFSFSSICCTHAPLRTPAETNAGNRLPETMSSHLARDFSVPDKKIFHLLKSRLVTIKRGGKDTDGVMNPDAFFTSGIFFRFILRMMKSLQVEFDFTDKEFEYFYHFT